MSVNSEMTAIADLIRGLRGVSGKMGLDAMKGHLQDEQDGLDSALTALSEKGVEVPDGTNVTGLASLIAAIEAGGGSGGGGVVTGTITPASTSKLTITHNLGRQPNFVCLFITSESATALNTKWKMCLAIGSRFAETIQLEAYNNGGSNYYVNRNSYDISGTIAGDIFRAVNENTFTYSCNEGEVQTGNTYRWVVG